MRGNRRTFLKEAGAAVAVSWSGGTAAPARPADDAAPLPTGLTLATMRRDGRTSLGIRTERGILDVPRAASALGVKAPATIDEVFRHGGGPALRRLVERAAGRPGRGLFLAEDRVEFGPCVTRPEKIVCVGLNYRKHAAETRNPVPKEPILFNKYNSSLLGHRGTIHVSREAAAQFDYEVELVMVIGKVTRNVEPADALAHVFGYCTGNDFSARDLQHRSSQWMLGKALDGAAPIGPYLVTADQVPDPNALKLECRVNGSVRQSSSTADMIFDCKTLVAYISKYMTLVPGDIIFTGTPEGVIAGYPKDKQVWLKPRDRVTCSIEKLGELAFELA